MGSMSEIERLARGIRIEPGAAVDRRVLASAEEALAKSRRRGLGAPSKSRGRAVMRSRIMKIAAAAAIIAATVVGVAVFSGPDEQPGEASVPTGNVSGEVVKDSSPYHNDGLLCGLDTRPERTEGASGYGYYFDGDGDYIEIPHIEGLGTEQTKMLWVYADGFTRSDSIYLIDEGGHESNNNWIELLDSDGNGVPNIRAGFDAGNLFDSDGEIEAGYWSHIAVVSTSAGDVFIYINGVFDSSRSGFSTSTQPEGIVIGADGQSRSACFKGFIDEVAIFNRALSDDEIRQVYQNSGRLRGNEAGLVGYWNFDRDEGDVVRDMGPYGNNGKLGGM